MRSSKSSPAMRSVHPENDFFFQFDAIGAIDALTHQCDELQHLGTGGPAHVDEKVGMALADHGVAHTKALQPQLVNQTPRRKPGRIFEDASGTFLVQRLARAAFGVGCANQFHDLGIGALHQLQFDAQDDVVWRKRRGPVAETDSILLDLLDGACGHAQQLDAPDQRPNFRPIGSGIHAKRSADAAGNADQTFRAVTTCARANLGGMEGLVGVPGSVGGALRMNAGAYGTEIGSLVRRIELLRMATGTIEQIEQNAVRFGYRASSFAPDDIILGVELELVERPYAEIVELIRAANAKRRASQPLNQKSAGCIFKNPPGLSAGRLIDELGLKGFRVGDAMVSERHANFFINVGRATCAEMLQLIALVRERVYRAYGVELEEEVILWVN